MTWDTVQQLVRILMQFAGGLLVSRGLITEDMATQLVGAVVSLGGIAWWIFWNQQQPAVGEVKKA